MISINIQIAVGTAVDIVCIVVDDRIGGVELHIGSGNTVCHSGGSVEGEFDAFCHILAGAQSHGAFNGEVVDQSVTLDGLSDTQIAVCTAQNFA